MPFGNSTFGFGQSQRIGGTRFGFGGGSGSPVILVTPNSLAFPDTSLGHVSPAQTLVVSGSGLTTDITVTAPVGFIVNLDGSNVNASPIVLPESAGIISPTTVYVLFSPVTVTSYAAHVDFTSAGAAPVMVNVTGTATTPSVFASVTNITGLNYTGSDGPSPSSATFVIKGVNLSPLAGNISFTPDANIEISNDGVTWTSSAIVIPYTGGAITTASIYRVRLKNGLTPATYNQTITLTGGGSPTFTMPCKGTVAVPPLSTTPSSLNFPDTTQYSNSAAQTFDVNGSSLYNNVIVTAPAGFIINLDGSDTDAGPITLVPVAGVVSKTIYCKFTPTAVQAYSGNISVASQYAVTVNVAVSGNGLASDFIVATGGTITTSGNMKIHTFNATGNFQVLVAPLGELVDALIVAGGGGAGGAAAASNKTGGGGGAGGMRRLSNIGVAVTTYVVTVGTGGAGGANSSGSDGSNGTDSSFRSFVSTGGGGGGGGVTSGSPKAGKNGGSGGGAGFGSNGTAGVRGQGTSGQGYNGGAVDVSGSTGTRGGGGGGAGNQGMVTGNVAIDSGYGGAGLTSKISGSNVVYAAGGNGHSGGASTANSGNGGNALLNSAGVAGADGVVIIAYPYTYNT